MFISDQVFFERMNIDALQLFQKKGDDLFLTYLTTMRVLLHSIVMYKKGHLSEEERLEFGYMHETESCFHAIERSEHLNTLIYLIANYTHTAYPQLVSEAFDTALDAYKKGSTERTKNEIYKLFKKAKVSVLKQFQEQNDPLKFINLYEEIAQKHMLKDSEKKKILKSLKKEFDTLLVWDIKSIRKEMEKGITNEQNKKTIQKIYDSFRK